MKKKILVVLVALTLVCSLLFCNLMGVSAASFDTSTYTTSESIETTEIEDSEDTQEPGQSQTPTQPGASNTDDITMTKEELEQYIYGILDKMTAEVDPDSYFKQTILPIIASALATLIITALFLFVPYMRNRARRKQVEGYAQALQEEKENLTTLLKATDAPAIKQALASLYGDYIEKFMTQFKTEFGPYLQTFASMKTTIDTEYAQIKALVSAATLAWSSRPEVTALLTESPEKSTLDKKTEEIEALRAYIKQIKGDEADAIIKKLEVE